MKLAQWLPHLTLALCQDVPGKAFHPTMLATYIIKSEMFIWGMVDAWERGVSHGRGALVVLGDFLVRIDAWERGVSSSRRFPNSGRCMGEGC